MRTYTKDEFAMIIGVAISALVAGFGIMMFYLALHEPSMLGYLSDSFIGVALFNAGVMGVIGIGSMWVNYQAVL